MQDIETALLTQVKTYSQRYRLFVPGDSIVIGVSGGPDSLCLLDVLHRLAPGLDLRLSVAHLNHGLRGAEAKADAAFVQAVAAGRGLPFHGGRRDVAALAAGRKLGLEEAARQARYAFLTEIARSADAKRVAVGHNADDQAETVLMHFLRGSGLPGLRGMLPALPLKEYRFLKGDVDPGLMLIRPLLEVPRPGIEAYCRARGLQPRFDRSNLDTTFFRNRLRHELLPLLESYNPNIRAVLRRTAQVTAGDYEVLRARLEADWQRVVRDETPEAITCDLGAWQALPVGLQRAILRRAIQRLRPGLRNIDFRHVERAVEGLASGPVRSGLRVTLPDQLLLTVVYDTFVIAGEDYRGPAPGLPYLASSEPLPVAVPGRTPLPEAGWTLQAKLLAPGAIDRATIRAAAGWECYLDAGVVGPRPWLRPRLAGDRFQPLGLAGHSKRLNEFMINAKIPPFQRPSIPLLISEAGDICWVCGWRVDHRARVTTATRQILHLRFAKADQSPA
ncbi:MAG: tRNA lysidine(34) synthetase TilS [Anaerolineae bacterium]